MKVAIDDLDDDFYKGGKVFLRVDFNVTEKIFVGAEAHWNWVDRSNGSYGTYGGRV